MGFTMTAPRLSARVAACPGRSASADLRGKHQKTSKANQKGKMIRATECRFAHRTIVAAQTRRGPQPIRSLCRHKYPSRRKKKITVTRWGRSWISRW